MPMYFPDLESVRRCAEMMKEHQKPEERYRGIVPRDESELSLARQQLAEYFRTVWKDEVQALEIEYAVSEKDYDEKMGEAVMRQFLM